MEGKLHVAAGGQEEDDLKMPEQDDTCKEEPMVVSLVRFPRHTATETEA